MCQTTSSHSRELANGVEELAYGGDGAGMVITVLGIRDILLYGMSDILVCAKKQNVGYVKVNMLEFKVTQFYPSFPCFL